MFCKDFLPAFCLVFHFHSSGFHKEIFFYSFKSNLPKFSFMDGAFDVVSIKASPNPSSPTFSPMLSSRSFIVLHFTFRSGINF